MLYRQPGRQPLNSPLLCETGPVGKLKSYLVDVFCGFLAYVAARWIWSGGAGIFDDLVFELLTFAFVFGLLQVLIRGRKLAQRGK